jgi:hypothetical protein
MKGLFALRHENLFTPGAYFRERKGGEGVFLQCPVARGTPVLRGGLVRARMQEERGGWNDRLGRSPGAFGE